MSDQYVGMKYELRVKPSWILFPCCVIGFFLSCCGATGHSQEIDRILKELDISGSLIDMAPFDIITLIPSESGKSVQVNLLELPNRKVPTNSRNTEKLRCVLTIFPGRQYEVAWKDIAKVTLWEDLLLDRAKKHIEDRNYAEAFEYLVHLRDNYPQVADFSALHQDFLFRTARDMATDGDLPHTLAALEELQRKFPGFKTKEVQNAISNVAKKLIDDLFQRDELSVARSMILRLDSEYKGSLPVVTQAKSKFKELAESYLVKSKAFREEGDFGRARTAAVKMLEIEPSLAGGKEYLQELVKAFPLVRVGVFQQSTKPDTAALADWPALRTGRLLSSPVFEFRNTGPEGGVYKFSFGNAVHSDDRQELDLTIQNPGKAKTPDSLILSQALLNKARVGGPQYMPSWASILDSVTVTGPERLKLKLRRPHVLPQAFLQWQLSSSGDTSYDRSAYRQKSADKERTRFEWAGETEPADFQPLEIQEVLYSDPMKAISDLIKGEIEFIDRLFPADAKRLGNVPAIKTEPYALPMVHMLVPRGKNPYMDDREFKRAMLYAINREVILRDEILGGAMTAADRLVSGPFPAGVSDSDAIAYAYNSSVESIPYDPRLAKVLVLLSQANQTAKAAKKREAAPKLPVVRLGVPNYESTRVAGQAIMQAWKIVGIESELVLYDKIPSPEDDAIDVLYLSASVWEPATDAERLFGKGGPAETSNQFIVQSLGKLNSARNWKEVRDGCQDLHALVASHLPILPLWQVSETFAYRTEMVGIAKRPIGLYQDVQKWRIQVK